MLFSNVGNHLMIKINNLTKTYGNNTVLENINLVVKKGQVYSLLGKNGAGKTTLINLILNMLIPDEGSIEVMDKPNTQLSTLDKKRLGIVGDDLALIEEFTGYEYLMFVGKIYKIPTDVLKKRLTDLFQYFFENEDDIRKPMAKYSTGMKKKIAFCSAILNTPDLLILDEPFSGLDPLVANQMVQFLKKYQSSERAIFISSHDLSYVEKVSTHIGVLNETKLVYNAPIQDFTENGKNELDDALLKIIKPNTSELDKMDWI